MNDYSDILSLNRPISHHPPMSLHDRAGQFAPFAALTGFDDEIAETGRWVDKRNEQTEEAMEEIRQMLQYIKDNLLPGSVLQVTYFEADAKKVGGKFRTAILPYRSVNETDGTLQFENGLLIPFEALESITIRNDL